jgi:NADH:ubiquinone oxidoreductase subunit 3 (subunit A)
MEVILTPPVALALYVALVAVLFAFGSKLAGKSPSSALKRSLYSSGEEAPTNQAAPGYRQFFGAALFFATLHLGILVLATGNLTPASGIFLAGLVLALVALILG